MYTLERIINIPRRVGTGRAAVVRAAKELFIPPQINFYPIYEQQQQPPCPRPTSSV
jgi:hypothetical protein